jgi:hypothetical protein
MHFNDFSELKNSMINLDQNKEKSNIKEKIL